MELGKAALELRVEWGAFLTPPKKGLALQSPTRLLKKSRGNSPPQNGRRKVLWTFWVPKREMYGFEGQEQKLLSRKKLATKTPLYCCTSSCDSLCYPCAPR
uniref:Uncharacterized protein n=1 Tax=Sphaerodactylus townsendi TaxID=933632 RepID=A0ACB8EM27_9SAUR